MKMKIILSIAIYFILLIILVLNMEDKSKVIKNSFLLFIISLVVALFFVNELVMDYIIGAIIRYFYYPSFTSIVVTLLLTMIVLIYSIYGDDVKDKTRMINYIFASYIFVSFVIFMSLEIDVNSYNALYEGDSLLCLRYISRTFMLWIIVNVLSKYFYYFLKKDDK